MKSETYVSPEIKEFSVCPDSSILQTSPSASSPENPDEGDE